MTARWSAASCAKGFKHRSKTSETATNRSLASSLSLSLSIPLSSSRSSIFLSLPLSRPLSLPLSLFLFLFSLYISLYLYLPDLSFFSFVSLSLPIPSESGRLSRQGWTHKIFLVYNCILKFLLLGRWHAWWRAIVATLFGGWVWGAMSVSRQAREDFWK